MENRGHLYDNITFRDGFSNSVYYKKGIDFKSDYFFSCLSDLNYTNVRDHSTVTSDLEATVLRLINIIRPRREDMT